MKNKALRGCLFAGEGVTPPHSFEKTGINQNVLVVGGTGAGKTVSVALPTALYTDGKSVIFPYNKKEMPELLRTFFEHEGYKTEVIDMADPENGTEGYDPLDFVLDEASLMEFEPNHALARDSFPYILSTADAVLFFCYNSRKPA